MPKWGVGVGQRGVETRGATKRPFASRTSSRRAWLIAVVLVALLLLGVLAAAPLIRADSATASRKSPSRTVVSTTAMPKSASVQTTVSVSTVASPPAVTRSVARVASQGATLTAVPTAPPRTLGALVLPAGLKVARLSVSFDVYGWAPDDTTGAKRLAVRVYHAAPADQQSAKVSGLEGHNAVFSLADYKGAPVDKGGRYQGIVEVRADKQGRDAMYLVSARLVP